MWKSENNSHRFPTKSIINSKILPKDFFELSSGIQSRKKTEHQLYIGPLLEWFRNN